MRTIKLSPISSTKRFSLYTLRCFALTALLVLFSTISAWATHFRYGNIQWTDNGGNQVTFKIQQAWRLTYFTPLPTLGSTVEIAAADGDVMFDFGDGQTQSIQLVVTSINASEDWFFGEVTYVHTYAAPGNYTAFFTGCCRISTLENNHDGDFRLQTKVNVGNSAHSTVSTVVPIVDLPVNNPTASFTIPTVDPDGHTVSFRLATADEAAGTGKSYVQPTGLSVNSSSGVVTFSTVGKVVGQLYTSQIMISNGVTEVGVDFIIRIVPNPPPSTPPYFVYPPTPDDGHSYNINVGTLLSFDVLAQDDDPGSSVTLTVVGMPPGATTTPSLPAPTFPATANPVTTQFNWTPTISNVGSYILVFTVTDNTGISVSTRVNIKVSAVCDPAFAASIAADPSTTTNGSQSVTLTASTINGNGGNTYDWGSAGTGASVVVTPSVTTTYEVTVTDAGGCTTKASITINVGEPVVLTCPQNTTLPAACQSQADVDAAFQAWLGTVVASGGCNGSLTNDNSGAPNACTGGTATVKFTYTSTCGQAETSCTATFTVPKNVTNPVFSSCPAGGDLGCNPTSIPGAGAPTATGCGTINITSLIGSVITNGCSRSRTTTYTATDACGHTATCTQVYTWKVDITKPVFTSVPASRDLGCNPSTIPACGVATASDNCGTPTVTTLTGSVVTNGCSRSRTTTYTATDACGNKATCTQVYTWKVDVTKPVFTSVPASRDLGCNPSTIPACGVATATDNCCTPTVTSQTGSVVTNGCSRSRTTTFTATDACGNKATCTQVYTWTVDVTKPVFTSCPTTITVGSCHNVVTYTVKASDNCCTPTVVCVPASGSTFSVGTTKVTCTATDKCGNKTVQTFNVVVAPKPTCTVSSPNPKPRPNCSGNKLCATASSGVSYSWTVSGTGWKITAGQTSSCITYTTGSSSGTFTLKVTDSYGCTSTCNTTVSCQGQTLSSDISEQPSITAENRALVSDLIVTAYPNPFAKTINFRFTSPVKGKALLETYDVIGRRLAVVFEGNVDAGAVNSIQYNVPDGNRASPLIYVLTVGSHKQHGMMLPTK